MAKIRQLLNGAVVQVARRQRICHRNRTKHSIAANTKCLVIKDGASGGTRNYCPECAHDILARAEVDLAALRAELSHS